jgi:CheY-like chemotaxis protein
MQETNENIDSKEAILWVDDEEIALEVWSLMLEKLGYTVLQARYGYEALEVFEKNKDRISLVILDMKMPGMDGCEVYDRLKEIKPEIKIIIFSGCIDQYAIDKLSKRNFSDYVEKPLELKELSEKIEEVLERP